MNVAKKNRIEWIDVAKGISIILVVYGHCGLNSVPFFGMWLAAYRMPFFFFVSGLLFSGRKYDNLKPFVAKRWKTLYRPYFIFSLLLAFGIYIKDSNDYLNSMVHYIKNGWGGWALWFIPVLSLTEIAFFYLSRLNLSNKYKVLILLISALIGRICFLLDLPNPYNIMFVFTSVMFYGFGSILKDKIIEFSHYNVRKLILSNLILFLLSCVFLFSKSKPEFAVNDLSDFWMYPAAIFGTLFMCNGAMVSEHIDIQLAKKIKQFIIYFGKNSYIVLAFHQIILQLLGKTHIFPNGVLQRLSMWILLYGLIYIVNRHLPFIIGRNK